jgi:short-subunit dehydrogenase
MPRSTHTASASAVRPPFASLDLSAIRQQAFAIDRQAGDIEILIAAVFDKVDELLGHTPAGMEAINAINCFATCALHNAARIKVTGTNILHLTSEGGEA